MRLRKYIAMVTANLSYFCGNVADKMKTDKDEINFWRGNKRSTFTDDVRDHNVLINLEILNINKTIADRKMNVL